MNAWLGTALALAAGAAAGLVTAILNVRFRILHLLASILTMIALYSINLRIMGRPNIALLGETTMLTPFEQLGLPVAWVRPLVLLVLVAVCAALLVRFLASELGLAMRATGVNPRMAEAQGIRVGAVTCLGMALSNALVALAGALFAQANGFADVTLGTGTIVVGLAAVIIGETLLPRPTVLAAVVGCLLGSVFYRIVVALALEADFLGLRVLRPEPGHRAPGRRRLDPAGDPRAAAGPAGAGAMIELEGVEVVFHAGSVLETRALRGIDLAIPEGQFVTVIGSNGAGKSTLLNVLAGTVRATAGRIAIDGTDVTAQGAAARARLLARVFQDPLGGTCAALTIEENLALAEARGRGRGLAAGGGGRRPGALARAAGRSRPRAGGPARRPHGAALGRAAAGGGAADGDHGAVQDPAARRAHRGPRPAHGRVRAGAHDAGWWASCA